MTVEIWGKNFKVLVGLSKCVFVRVECVLK